MFFPKAVLPYNTGAQHRVDTAKQICEGCPARLQCYQTAVANQEQHGVWGGVDFNKRRYDREPQPCGTYAAYHRHKYQGETPCQECDKARNEYRQQQRTKRKGNS